MWYPNNAFFGVLDSSFICQLEHHIIFLINLIIIN
jgi:hypothetical protein